jgi:hypothetical protein
MLSAISAGFCTSISIEAVRMILRPAVALDIVEVAGANINLALTGIGSAISNLVALSAAEFCLG